MNGWWLIALCVGIAPFLIIGLGIGLLWLRDPSRKPIPKRQPGKHG